MLQCKNNIVVPISEIHDYARRTQMIMLYQIVQTIKYCTGKMCVRYQKYVVCQKHISTYYIIHLNYMYITQLYILSAKVQTVGTQWQRGAATFIVFTAHCSRVSSAAARRSTAADSSNATQFSSGVRVQTPSRVVGPMLAALLPYDGITKNIISVSISATLACLLKKRLQCDISPHSLKA